MSFDWTVVDAQPREDFTILVTFYDGKKKIFDARPLLSNRIMEKARNPGFFMKAHVEHGTVAWNDDLDICPEALYDEGVPVDAFPVE